MHASPSTHNTPVLGYCIIFTVSYRNMIKAFLTASHIFTTLKQFGELSDEVCMYVCRL